jgi:hypothetical protein
MIMTESPDCRRTIGNAWRHRRNHLWRFPRPQGVAAAGRQPYQGAGVEFNVSARNFLEIPNAAS